MGCQLR